MTVSTVGRYLAMSGALLLFVLTSPANARRTSQADLLIRTGRVQLVNGYPDSASSSLKEALRLEPDNAFATAELGRALVALDRLDSAETLFLRADSLAPRKGYLAFGRGFVALHNGDTDAAGDFFGEAARQDRRNADVQVELAKLMMTKIAGNIRANQRLERALRSDPEHPEARFLLGQIRERSRRLDEAIKEYEFQLQTNPGHTRSTIRLGYLYLETGQPWHSRQWFMDALASSSGRELELTLALAATYLGDLQFTVAQQFYVQAFLLMSDDERGYYEDITLLASPQERAYLAQATDEERLQFAQRFWLKRDPTPATQLNERLLEHFRRVWYARLTYSEGMDPWDKRGDAYVMYGPPDHRATYTDPNFVVPREVDAIRQRYLHKIYGPTVPDIIANSHMPAFPLIDPVDYASEGSLHKFGGDEDPYFDDFTQESRFRRLNSVDDFGDNSVVFSMTESRAALIPWEVWTYVDLAGGVQFTFVDNFATKAYTFAEPPPTSAMDLETSMKEAAPEQQFTMAQSSARERFAYRPTGQPLRFFYYTAQFRAPDNETQLDVYYGVPIGQLTFRKDGDEYLAEMQSGIAIFDTAWDVRGRSLDRMQLLADSPPAPETGAIQFDMRSVRLMGGENILLNVQATDEMSRRYGAYQENVKILRYDMTRLSMSDIVLAGRIRTARPDDSEKFVRNGLYILPMAALAFTNSMPMHVYFEIYNLERGEDYGDTEYEVEHAVRAESEEGGILSSVGRILGGSSQRVGVGQVIEGFRSAESQRFSIDTANLSPGRYTLIITVRDLKSNQSVTKQREFTILESN